MILFGAVYGVHTYSHNNYIEIMVNLGMMGFILYYSYYIFLIRKLWLKKNNASNLRNFFLAFMISLFVFELGAVTYNMNLIQVVISLANGFLVCKEVKSEKNGAIIRNGS